ncbi:MAG: acyl carrier protein [Parvibaculaceae bacterium]|jgi:acyl carrier protein
MTANEAKAIILQVLKDLELIDEETAELVAGGQKDVELSALRIDSIAVVDLCVGLEEHVGREVTIEELVENSTIGRLADHFAGTPVEALQARG